MTAAGPPSEGSVSRRLPSMNGAGRSDGDADSDASSSANAGDQSDRKDVDVLTQVLSNRSEEYRLMFRLPSDEVLLQDFNCALQENILLQKTIPFHEVTCVRKAKTVAIFPNAIEIVAGGKKHLFGSFLSRDEAYRLIVDGWAQHGGDITAMDTKSEASNQENNIYERVQGCKASSDDASSSNRDKDAIVLAENKPMPNVKVENMENGGKENANRWSHFTWTTEDMDPPSVPEHFTIVAESKFPVLLEDFFDLFVSDHAVGFLKDFHGRCADKDFQCTSWRRHEQFGHIRNVSFMHPVKVYIGARFGNCQEVQKFQVYKNSHLIIETSQNILDVPYGDYFEVQGMWDVVQDKGENSCTVKVYNNVAFSKKTMFRGKIEQSTREECRDVYANWISCAHQVLKGKNIGLLKAAGISEQKTCMVQENDNEFGSHPELEKSIENPTINSNILRNVHETTTISTLVIDKTIKEKCEQSALVPILRESWESFLSHIRTQSLFPLVLAVAFVLFILMQLSIILLLTRAPEVHMVSAGNSMREGSAYSVEHIEWLEKRVNYLKEEMLLLEGRMERMRHEYDFLKSYVRSLEQLKAKS